MVLVLSALRLRCILDHLEAVTGGELAQRIHVSALPIKMDRHNRFCVRSNGVLNAFRIEIVRVWVWLDRDWLRPSVGNCQPGGNVRVGRNNNLVARPNSEGAQDQVQSLEPVAYTDAMSSSAISCKLCFERT